MKDIDAASIAWAMARMEGDAGWTATFHELAHLRLASDRPIPRFLRDKLADVHRAAARGGEGRLVVIGKKMGVAGKPLKFPPLLVLMTARCVCEKNPRNLTRQECGLVSKAMGPGRNGKLADYRTVKSLIEEGFRLLERTPLEVVLASLPERPFYFYGDDFTEWHRLGWDAVKDSPAVAAARKRLDDTIERLRAEGGGVHLTP